MGLGCQAACKRRRRAERHRTAWWAPDRCATAGVAAAQVGRLLAALSIACEACETFSADHGDTR